MNKKFIGISLSIFLLFLIGTGCISEYPINHNQNKSIVTNVIWYPTTSIMREEYNRLETGDIVAGIDVTGDKKAKLDFNFSDNTQDAVLVIDNLNLSSDEFAVYIRGGDSGTIFDLGGYYNIYITTGNDWDNKTRKFKINPNYYKLIEPIHIVNQLWDWRGDGRFHQITYEIWTLNIDRLLINNTMTSKISENEFINLERVKNETELYEMKYQNLKIHQERYNQSL